MDSDTLTRTLLALVGSEAGRSYERYFATPASPPMDEGEVAHEERAIATAPVSIDSVIFMSYFKMYLSLTGKMA